MSGIPAWKKQYERRKANGECPRCGNKMDRAGHYCSVCLIKQNEYKKELRKFVKALGICPECQKNSLIGGQKTCLECLAKRAEYRARKNRPLNDVEKLKMRARGKIRHQERISKGLCTRCGIIKAMPGKKKCGKCLMKDAELHRLRYS